jgi:CTP-dependent riboflavin kinase
MISIELDNEACKAFASLAKEHYILDTYVPRPEVGESEKAVFQQFRTFVRAAKRNAGEADLGQSEAVRARRSENGYAVDLTDAASQAVTHVFSEIMRLLDETEMHARTGRTKGYYQDLLTRTFGA